MKKLVLIVPLLLVGCVGLRMNQTKGTASYYRLGGQDIRDLHAKKMGADGELLEVSLGRATVAEPDILKPGEWSDIIADYIGAGLAQDAMGQLGIVQEILGENGIDIDLDDVKEKIAERLGGNGGNGGGSSAGDNNGSDSAGGDSGGGQVNTNAQQDAHGNTIYWSEYVTENWPDGDPRYHVYDENNDADVNKGLWKPDSESRPGEPVMLLPAYMSRVGVKRLLVGGRDVTDKARKYPTNLLPILANGRRIHYNTGKANNGTPVEVTLDDGSVYGTTIEVGTRRQDPIGFRQIEGPDEPDRDPVEADDLPNIDDALEEMERQDQEDIDATIDRVNDAIEEAANGN